MPGSFFGATKRRVPRPTLRCQPGPSIITELSAPGPLTARTPSPPSDLSHPAQRLRRTYNNSVVQHPQDMCFRARSNSPWRFCSTRPSQAAKSLAGALEIGSMPKDRWSFKTLPGPRGFFNQACLERARTPALVESTDVTPGQETKTLLSRYVVSRQTGQSLQGVSVSLHAAAANRPS